MYVHMLYMLNNMDISMAIEVNLKEQEDGCN